MHDQACHRVSCPFRQAQICGCRSCTNKFQHQYKLANLSNLLNSKTTSTYHYQTLPNIEQNLLHQPQLHCWEHELPLNLHLGRVDKRDKALRPLWGQLPNLQTTSGSLKKHSRVNMHRKDDLSNNLSGSFGGEANNLCQSRRLPGCHL